MICVFDIEANDFLEHVTKIHCIGINDKVYTDIDEAVEILSNADVIIGHNIIGYDIPVINLFFPFFKPKKIIDTLVLSRLIHGDIKDSDFARKNFPTKLIGRHSLEAWGHRIGNYKADFTAGFEELTDEMIEYCRQDVAVTKKLYDKLISENYSQQAIDLEHKVAQLCFEQQERGFAFDKHNAQLLVSELSDKREQLKRLLKVAFSDWEIKTPFTPKVNNKTRGYVKGVETFKVKKIEFNPASRDHVANRLKEKRGWKPKIFTADGKPKVDEQVLSELDYPEAQLLVEFYMLQKRLGQISEGSQAWLKHEKEGRIHGHVNTLGTITRRASHNHPNIGQVPANNKPHGKKCRELFQASEGNVLVGVDISSLELALLSHYLFPYDDGLYAKELDSGDIHTTNQKAAGLATRDESKRFIYAFLYGASTKKIAEILGQGHKYGAKIKKEFLENLPALDRLIKSVQKASQRGYLKTLDGGRIKVRSQHSALNSLLQGAGAVVCKQWLVILQEDLIKNNIDAKQVAWIHDEVQLDVRKEHVEMAGKTVVDAIRKTGEHFNLRIKLTGEWNSGANWSETH